MASNGTEAAARRRRRRVGRLAGRRQCVSGRGPPKSSVECGALQRKVVVQASPRRSGGSGGWTLAGKMSTPRKGWGPKRSFQRNRI
jgi:hypothetical protein